MIINQSKKKTNFIMSYNFVGSPYIHVRSKQCELLFLLIGNGNLICLAKGKLSQYCITKSILFANISIFIITLIGMCPSLLYQISPSWNPSKLQQNSYVGRYLIVDKVLGCIDHHLLHQSPSLTQ